MQILVNLIASFFRPVIAVFISIVGAISLLLGAIANPQGAVNTFICKIIDLVVSALPSTPENLKIGSLLQSVGNSIPIVGYGVVLQIFQMAVAMLSIVLVIKIYKLIPFKAT